MDGPVRTRENTDGTREVAGPGLRKAGEDSQLWPSGPGAARSGDTGAEGRPCRVPLHTEVGKNNARTHESGNPPHFGLPRFETKAGTGRREFPLPGAHRQENAPSPPSPGQQFECGFLPATPFPRPSAGPRWRTETWRRGGQGQRHGAPSLDGPTRPSPVSPSHPVPEAGGRTQAGAAVETLRAWGAGRTGQRPPRASSTPWKPRNHRSV